MAPLIHTGVAAILPDIACLRELEPGDQTVDFVHLLLDIGDVDADVVDGISELFVRERSVRMTQQRIIQIPDQLPDRISLQLLPG